MLGAFLNAPLGMEFAERGTRTIIIVFSWGRYGIREILYFRFANYEKAALGKLSGCAADFICRHGYPGFKTFHALAQHSLSIQVILSAGPGATTTSADVAPRNANKRPGINK